jgi:hypothetical protein
MERDFTQSATERELLHDGAYRVKQFARIEVGYNEFRKKPRVFGPCNDLVLLKMGDLRNDEFAV